MRISILCKGTQIASLTAVAVVAALTLGGCGKKEQPKESSPAPSASADPASDLKAFLANDKAPLTRPIYEKLVLDLTSCEVTERGVHPKCAAYQNLRKARNRKTSLREMREMNAAVGKKLIGHEHPAVRLQAAKLLQSVFGSDKDVQKVIIDAAKKEKEPAVLAAMLRTVGSKHKTNEDIKSLLLKMADNDSEVVRREAMSWFLTSFGEGVEGTFDKVLEKVEKDPSEDVRAYLCNRLYGSSDERALEVFKKYLEAEDTPKKIYNACWNGVINSWTGFPKPRKPSKEGYELTMKILEAKPRTKERPSWSGISTLRSAKTEYRETDRFGNAWLEAVKDWYKKDRLLRALKGIVTDTEANWMARTAALRVMHELGEPKATFTLMQTKYKDAKVGDDFHVKRQVDDILRKMEAQAARAAGSAVPGGRGRPGRPDRRGPRGARPDPRPGAPQPPPGTPAAPAAPKAPAAPAAPPPGAAP